MMLIIIQHYFTLLLSVGLSCLCLFLIGLYWIVRIYHQPRSVSTVEQNMMSEAVMAIAGNDVIATQLDLAFAYIETNQKKSAQVILERIIKQGSENEQQEAKRLLGLI